MTLPLSFWRSPLLDALPWLSHGVTHRTGGVSDAPYDSLNLGLHVSDDPCRVMENRRRVAAALGFSAERLVTAEQVHGGNAAVVTEADAGSTIPGVDGLVTGTPGLLLALFFADCVPVLFADPERRVIGVAHAGWRGLVGGILEATVSAMRESFSSQPESLVAAIGPCIGPCCFEVGEEVAAHFPTETARIPDWPRPHVDLGEAAANRLKAVGIARERITEMDKCTSCHPERYFSHRRDRGRTGRMAAVIGIRDAV
jgi:polyphenol oxidase